MAAEWMKSRQTKFGAYAAVYIIVMLGVLGAINFLANRYDKSYDATKNKQFSLSDQTIKVVKGLKTDVKFTYFGQTDSFPQAKDTLERYASLSPKVHVDYVDPVKKPQIAKAAGFRSDSPVVVSSGTRQEGAKQLSEEEVTGALIRSQKSGERNVCFLQGAGEHSPDDTESGGFSFAKQLLERDNYKTKTVTLKPAAPEPGKTVAIGQTAPTGAVEVPKDCTALVIGGPQTAFPTPEVQALKTYVEGGGRALFMLDNVLPIGRSEPAAENPELIAMLTGWGVTVNKDLVLDLSGIGQLFGFGPEVVVVAQYETHPIVQPLARVMTAFPLVRSLEVKSADKASVQKLVSTSEDAVALDSIPANGAVDPRKGKKGPHTLAAAGTFSGGSQGRFVVVGSSLWAQNSLVGSRQLGNRDLLVNSVNWLTSDEDLISIRPKTPEDQQFTVTAQKLNSMFWLSIVIFPLGVVGFGLATWWKRR
jgi:ABC-type uncharacterized transport system involved in gliding motility auxiliary subunit